MLGPVTPGRSSTRSGPSARYWPTASPKNEKDFALLSGARRAAYRSGRVMRGTTRANPHTTVRCPKRSTAAPWEIRVGSGFPDSGPPLLVRAPPRRREGGRGPACRRRSRPFRFRRATVRRRQRRRPNCQAGAPTRRLLRSCACGPGPRGRRSRRPDRLPERRWPAEGGKIRPTRAPPTAPIFAPVPVSWLVSLTWIFPSLSRSTRASASTSIASSAASCLREFQAASAAAESLYAAT